MTQCERIVQYMQMFGSITPYDAFKDLGITRLSARIYDLKKEGYEIRSEIETSKNRFGDKVHYTRYSIWKKGVKNV